jgi:hypothetical protein
MTVLSRQHSARETAPSCWLLATSRTGTILRGDKGANPQRESRDERNRRIKRRAARAN